MIAPVPELPDGAVRPPVPRYNRYIRFQIIALAFMATFIFSMSRYNFGSAMICMLKPNSTNSTNQTDVGDKKYVDWPSDAKHLVVSMQYAGHLIMAIPAGYICDRFGAKWPLLAAITWALLINLITPIVGQMVPSVWGVAMLRFLFGFGNAMMSPAESFILAHWIPTKGKSRATALVSAGMQVSIIFSYLIFTEICSHSNWTWIFYTTFLLGLPWVFLWICLMVDTPEESKRISSAELNLINEALADYKCSGQKLSCGEIPWRKCLGSTVTWANMAAHFGFGFSAVTLFTYLPTYMKDVLKLGKWIGLLSSLPPLAYVVAKLSFSLTYAPLLNYISRTTLCRVSNSVGSFGMALCLLSASFFDEKSPAGGVAFMALGLMLAGGFSPGTFTSIHLMAPNYAGLVKSLAESSLVLGCLVAPMVLRAIVDKRTREEYQIVFLIMMAVLIVMGIVYVIFVDTDVQDWAKQETPKTSVTDTDPTATPADVDVADAANSEETENSSEN